MGFDDGLSGDPTLFATAGYDYPLPERLIAQQPAADRDGSRLLVLDRHADTVSHHQFRDITGFFQPTDVLVLNNTEVVPARLAGAKDSGGRVEALVLDYPDPSRQTPETGRFVSRCIIKASKRPKNGSWMAFGPELRAQVLAFDDGVFTVGFVFEGDFEPLLRRLGAVPLPPYIRRPDAEAGAARDRDAYQTVYASRKGAVAAPTAGLHFTRALLERIRSSGVTIVEITLHVGYGTFVPVRVDDIRRHRMHGERYSVGSPAASVIRQAKQEGRRVVAVGTTCVRTLETAAAATGAVHSGSGTADLFIYPGYRFRVVDALITNFHLPQSTLLMLVSALAGRDRVLSAYREAVQREYRFFSYGDAMLIL